MLTADSVDIDYDNTSHSLTVTGLWANGPSGGWSEEISKPASGADQVEFGLLGAEQGTSPEEIKVGGLLAVVGSDKKLSTLSLGHLLIRRLCSLYLYRTYNVLISLATSYSAQECKLRRLVLKTDRSPPYHVYHHSSVYLGATTLRAK